MKRILVIFAITLSSWFVTSAHAAQELGMRTATQVSKAYELEQQNKLTEAIRVLEETQPSSTYDKAYVARMLGIYYWQAEQPQRAIRQLQIAVDSQAFKQDQGWQTERMLAELLLSEQQPEQALGHFERLVKHDQAHKISSQQLANVWLNTARAHYLMQQWVPLLVSLKHYHQLDNKPRISPLSLQLSAEMQLSRLQNAIVTTQKLLALQPDHVIWWQQLSSLYVQTRQYKLALATLVSAERAGIQIPDNLQLSKAQLYAQQGIPEKAAISYQTLQVDEADIDTIVKQAQQWQMAREWSKARSAWLAAARLNNQYFEQVARLELQQGDFQSALASLDKVSRSDQQPTLLLKVRAYVGLKEYQQAQTVARLAHQQKPSPQSARWLEYLDQLTTTD